MGGRKSKMGVLAPLTSIQSSGHSDAWASVSITVALPALSGLTPEESTAWPFQCVRVKMLWNPPPPVQIRGGSGDRHVTTSTDKQGHFPRGHPGGLWAN